MADLLIFGMGFLGRAVARQAVARGWTVAGTSRRGAGDGLTDPTDPGALSRVLARSRAVLVTAPPDASGCPGLSALEPHLRPGSPATSRVEWIGYVSSTAVYGDRDGGWVFEDSELNAASIAGARRVDAEQAWARLGAGAGIAVARFRLPALYGPGRSALDRIRDGTARRVKKPGQVFNRIHVEDAAAGVLAALDRPRADAVYNLTDDDPASMEEVLLAAAARLKLPAPPETDLSDPAVSEAMRGYYLDSKRVSNARAKAELGWRPAFPTWREGLESLLAPDDGTSPTPKD